MIKKQLQPDITIGNFALVKKLQLNSFKKHLRKKPVELKNRIIQLGDDLEGNGNYFQIKGNWLSHELTIAPLCLIDWTRSLHNAYKGKLKNLLA